MCSIPCLDERTLGPVFIVFGLDLADRDLGAILGEDDVLLFHLAHAALGEFVGVEVDLVSYVTETGDDGEEDDERDEVCDCAHGGWMVSFRDTRVSR